ncbi:hypothetical protein ACFL59_01805, partial [Planctomycetota bacterium]
SREVVRVSDARRLSGTAPMPDRHRLVGLWAATLASLWIIDAIWFKIGCDDHWWHLLTGRVIVETGAIPTTDPFSYTFAGKAWLNWEWLGSLILYGFYSAFGPLGLTLLRGLALGATAAILSISGTPARKHERPAAIMWRFSFLLLVLLVVYPRLADRPHTMAFAFIACAGWLAERATTRGTRWPLASVVLLTLIWANIHPSWPLALVIVGAAWLNVAWKEWETRSLGATIRGTVRWPLVLLLMLVVARLNSFVVVGPSEAVGELFGETVSAEWGPTLSYLSLTEANGLKLFLGVIAISGVSLLVTRKGMPPGDLLLAISLAVAAFRHARFAAVFCIVVYPIVLRRWAQLEPLKRSDSRTAHSVAMMGLAFALALLLLRAERATFNRSPGLGVDEVANPVGALDFVARHGLTANPLTNTTTSASYFLWRRWPAQKTFIDGRVPTLYSPEFYARYANAKTSQGFQDLLDEYDVGLFLIDRGRNGRQSSSIAHYLRQHSQWMLTYFDTHSAVFVRYDAVPHGFCEREAFVLLDPFDGTHSHQTDRLDPRMFEKLLAEMHRASFNAPDDPTGPLALFQYLSTEAPQTGTQQFQQAWQLAQQCGGCPLLERAIREAAEERGIDLLGEIERGEHRGVQSGQ